MLTKSLTSSAEKPSCDRKPLAGVLGPWSLSPHLRADHMENSMKVRMRYIQNMQWRQQKGRDKKTPKTTSIRFWCQFWCHSWCQKEKGQRLNTSDLCF